jgi:lipoyl(octanoyl) transferase
MAHRVELPRRWRILRDPPGAAAHNMAIDEALARTRRADEGVLRIYRWRRPTLSFGRNQPALDRYDPHALDAFGVEAVRRPTGGREVLHDRELTYAVILPLRTADGVRGSYRRINAALVHALRTLGVVARAADESHPVLPPDAGACFGDPAPGEVIVGEGKVIGSAQRRIGEHLLQHGSLLLSPPTVGLAALRIAPPDPFEGHGCSLAELGVGPFGFDRVAAAVEAALAGSYGGAWERGRLREEEGEVAEHLRRQYESPGWTWRR